MQRMSFASSQSSSFLCSALTTLLLWLQVCSEQLQHLQSMLAARVHHHEAQQCGLYLSCCTGTQAVQHTSGSWNLCFCLRDVLNTLHTYTSCVLVLVTITCSVCSGSHAAKVTNRVHSFSSSRHVPFASAHLALIPYDLRLACSWYFCL